MKTQVTFTAVLQRFQQMGEKTGWTYIVVPEAISLQLHSTDRKGYRVKGFLNEVPIAQVALMPMGEGGFDFARECGHAQTTATTSWRHYSSAVE
ncbi:DUF1905 domain-containing protein [Phnomibacter ginsenosidimutans]|uniref:DUF1905 domain-containing protein n=1 Tax=Phnomibacter ginsenosidimutans TaxID=2676868 RepID=UPI0018D25BFC|nr:DUF1905 domain-containing protein [Phnomibacter ginsenosidimutans]